MLCRDQERRAVWPLLSGLVLFAMFINSVIWVFCPHMSGSSDGCFARHFAAEPHKHFDNVGMEKMHCADMQMAQMHMESMPVDKRVTDVDDASSENPSSASETESIADTTSFRFTEIQRTVASSVSQPSDPCSHCMMHSQSQASARLQTVATSSSSSDMTATDSSVTVVDALPAVSSFVEVHEHGPPGPTTPRYVLVGSFRI